MQRRFFGYIWTQDCLWCICNHPPALCSFFIAAHPSHIGHFVSGPVADWFPYLVIVQRTSWVIDSYAPIRYRTIQARVAFSCNLFCVVLFPLAGQDSSLNPCTGQSSTPPRNRVPSWSVVTTRHVQLDGSSFFCTLSNSTVVPNLCSMSCTQAVQSVTRLVSTSSSGC